MAAAKPTLAQIRYLVKLHAIQATGRTPVPADLPPMTEAEAAAPGSPLAYRCTDSAYGDKPGEPRDSRYLRDVMAHTISLDSCLELPAPPAWCVPTDARAFRKLRSKDVASDILATALHLDERIPRGWHQGHEYLRPKFDNVASLMQHVFTSAHFEGRKLLCSVRRSRGRVLRTQRCPLTDGKEPRRPDYPTSCVACDLELGNMEYVLLAHETLFLTDLAWDCGMSAPALAVTCIDGLALEADVAAGVLTQDDVHAVIGVLAAVAGACDSLVGGEVPPRAYAASHTRIVLLLPPPPQSVPGRHRHQSACTLAGPLTLAPGPTMTAPATSGSSHRSSRTRGWCSPPSARRMCWRRRRRSSPRRAGPHRSPRACSSRASSTGAPASSTTQPLGHPRRRQCSPRRILRPAACTSRGWSMRSQVTAAAGGDCDGCINGTQQLTLFGSTIAEECPTRTLLP